MGTLLLRLAAPLQSWGVDSKFETRNTGSIPTKSGLTGLLAAALGRRRDEPVEDLAALRLGVRVDQPGQLLRDFHTAHMEQDHWQFCYKGKPVESAYVTYRYYLADAVFLAGLESEDETLLRRLDEALRRPVFPLFLGRRSCPPTLPLSLGVRETALLPALRAEPWLAAAWRQQRLEPRLRLLEECAPGEPNAQRLRDVPLSFSPLDRRYGSRALAERGYCGRPVGTEHDAMAELR